MMMKTGAREAAAGGGGAREARAGEEDQRVSGGGQDGQGCSAEERGERRAPGREVHGGRARGNAAAVEGQVRSEPIPLNDKCKYDF